MEKKFQKQRTPNNKQLNYFIKNYIVAKYDKLFLEFWIEEREISKT